MISPPARVLSPLKMGIAIVSLMNLTEPSAKPKFAPPGCSLWNP